MRSIHALLLLTAFSFSCRGQEERPPKNELAFGLGGLPSLSRNDSPQLIVGPGLGLQVNYGRLLGGRKVAWYGEVHFLASPLREVTSSVSSATQNFASLYVTPGLRVKFFPTSRVSSYFSIGGGYVDYEHSTTEINGQLNPASRQLARGVLDFGAGVDVRLWRRIALRGEVRDFYTGSPNYNVASISGGQHNLVAGGAFVLRWH